METQTRQLAAIMFTDIVGYTALMGKDSARALALIARSRELQKPLVEKYNGKWLKEMGDGVMAQFLSALDAVNCASEIQKASRVDFDGELRIGIHLGDITFDNNDVYGDGVNIASRLESIADPGGICISDSIYHAITGMGDFSTEYLGEIKLKNVEDPVRTYAVLEEESGDRSKTGHNIFELVKPKYLVPLAIAILLVISAVWQFEGGIPLGKSENPTLVVLPLTLVNPDSTNEYLVEGLTRELIRSLGKISSVSVINPTTSMRYLGSMQPVTEAQGDLSDIDYMLVGSFEKNGNLIDLSLELLNDRREVVWSDSYREDMARIPQMIGTIVANISSAVDIELSPDQAHRIKEIAAVDPEIYGLKLKGMNHLDKWEIQQGLVYLEEATDKNPADAHAWAGLAAGYVKLGHSPLATPLTWPKAKKAAERAIELDSTLAEAWAALAHIKTYSFWDYEGAEDAYRIANQLNPSLAMNHFHYSWYLYLFDRLDEAIAEHKRAQELDPFVPNHTAYLALLLAEAGRFDQAFVEIRRALEMDDHAYRYWLLGKIHLLQGNYDSAIITFDKVVEMHEAVGLFTAVQYLELEQLDKGMELIREMESKPLGPFWANKLSLSYAAMDSADKFFYYANYEPAHAFTPWLRKEVKSLPILNDPRFKQLMDKMNLPMPVVDGEMARVQ